MVTARQIRKTLGEHYLDFMNTNNPQGFSPDDDREIDPNSIGGILIEVALSDGLTKEEVKERAGRIRKILPTKGFQRMHSLSVQYVSNALGYKDWQHAIRHLAEGDVIPNIRKTASGVAMEIYSPQSKTINLTKWNPTHDFPEDFRLLAETNDNHANLVREFLKEMEESRTLPRGRVMRALYLKYLTRVKPCTLLAIGVDGVQQYYPRSFVYAVIRFLSK